MTTILDEKKILENSQKNIFSLKKKSKNLSKLKISFYEKFKKAQYDEDIPKMNLYFSYLHRTSILSKKIYSKSYKEFQEIKDTLPRLTVNIPQGVFYDENSSSSSSLTKIQVELVKYVQIIQKYLDEIVGKEDLFTYIENYIDNEEKLLQLLQYQKETIFNEISEEHQLYELLLKEKELSDRVIISIEKIFDETQTFSQKIKKMLKDSQPYISNISRHPLSNTFLGAEKAGEFLEHNASAFAATIVTLSCIGNVALLLGNPEITALTSATILVMAEYGEGLQAIPAIKKFSREKYANFRTALQRWSFKKQEISNLT